MKGPNQAVSIQRELWKDTTQGNLRPQAQHSVRGRVLRWAGTGLPCWGSVLAPCVLVPGLLLGAHPSLFVVTCALTAVVPACCVYPVRS